MVLAISGGPAAWNPHDRVRVADVRAGAMTSVVHVVDDDAAVRSSLRFLLGSVGFAVEDHATAEAFLLAAAVRPVGCVLTDVRDAGPGWAGAAGATGGARPATSGDRDDRAR